MNIQEREQLTRFLQQLTQAQAARKDSEAASLIGEACLRQPDAAYLLVQRAMLLDQAVQESTLQIARLQEALEQARNQARAVNDSGSFLDPNAWGNSAAARPGQAPQAAFHPTTPAPAAAPANAPAPAPSAWGSGMLGNIATTAAGVVAGGFLFQGIGHLLGNQNSHSPNAANPGSANSLASSEETAASTTETKAGTGTTETETGTSNAGVFDTSSVDDFIADDMDDIV